VSTEVITAWHAVSERAVVSLIGKQPNNGAETSVGKCRLSLAFTGASYTWSHVLFRRVDGARLGNADQVQRYGRGSCFGWQHRGTAQRTAVISDMPESPGSVTTDVRFARGGQV
jgi:hypothetical protein